MTAFLTLEKLTKSAFAAYGEVIETDGAEVLSINAGSTARYHDLATIDVARGNGRPLLSIFRATPRRFPYPLSMMERHPLGSQAFMPLSRQPFVVVVGGHGDTVASADLRGFLAAPGQGVNYARNVWHHPLIAYGKTCDFVVVDRGGAGDNLQEIDLPEPYKKVAQPQGLGDAESSKGLLSQGLCE